MSTIDHHWIDCRHSLPPVDQVVDTIIMDEKGTRNATQLKRSTNARDTEPLVFSRWINVRLLHPNPLEEAMSDKLKAADGFKEIIRLLESSDFDLNIGDAISVCYAHLAAYEAAPAEAVGDVRILINALKEISLNEDRENLDGDPAEAALEQCNAMAEEALEDYEKSKEKTP